MHVFAIDPAIHAALIGGVISGGVVLLGIAATEWIRRRASLREGLPQGTTGYLRTMPLFIHRMTDPPSTTIDIAPQEVNRQLISSISEMQQNARRLRLFRHRREVRRHTKMTLAQVQALAQRETAGGPPLTSDEVRALTSTGTRVNTLVLHLWEPTIDEVRWYRDHGVTEPYRGA
jgi:hypothetical protein